MQARKKVEMAAKVARKRATSKAKAGRTTDPRVAYLSERRDQGRSFVRCDEARRLFELPDWYSTRMFVTLAVLTDLADGKPISAPTTKNGNGKAKAPKTPKAKPAKVARIPSVTFDTAHKTLQVETADLVDLLTKVAPAIRTSGYTLPALGGVMFGWGVGRLELTGTDLETAVRAHIGVGKVAVHALAPFKLVRDALKFCSGPLTLEATSTKQSRSTSNGQDVTETVTELKITSSKRTFTLRPLAIEDYPKIAEPEGKVTFSVDASELAPVIARADLFASTDEARPVLTGQLWEYAKNTVEIVTTDSYRMGAQTVKVTGTDEGRAVMPSGPIKAFSRFARGRVDVRMGDGQVSLRSDGLLWIVRRIEGEYPNWRQLMPENSPTALTFTTDVFTESVKAARAFCASGSPVTLHLGKRSKIESSSRDVGSFGDTLDATWNGEEITLGCNPDYLLDVLSFTKNDSGAGAMHVRDNLKPFLFLGRPECRALLMPVRI